MFVDFFCNYFDDPGAVHGVIWSDESPSEFKNKFMVKFLQPLGQKHKTPFLCKYFTTSHGTGIVDRIGDNEKALVCAKVMSKGDSRIIVQL